MLHGSTQAQYGAFAGAVGADQGPVFSCFDREIDVGQDLPCFSAEGDVFQPKYIDISHVGSLIEAPKRGGRRTSWDHDMPFADHERTSKSFHDKTWCGQEYSLRVCLVSNLIHDRGDNSFEAQSMFRPLASGIMNSCVPLGSIMPGGFFPSRGGSCADVEHCGSSCRITNVSGPAGAPIK